MKIYRTFLIFFIGLISIIKAQDNYDSLITKGIKHIYNVEFAEASNTFNVLKKSYPAKPAGLFMEAMTIWWEILLDQKNEEKDDLFNNKIEEVVDFCDDILDENEFDSDALFFKGGAIGFRGLLNSVRRNWFDAAGDGADALPLVNRVYEIDTTNVDVKLGFGIYNYFAKTLPEKYPVARPLLLFIPEGNREQGLAELKAVAQNGKYTSVEARFTLGKIYYLFEKDYDTAILYFSSLHKEFPENPVFEKYLGRTLISNSGYDADSVYTRILEKCEKGKRGYNSTLKREAHYYLGMKLKNKFMNKKALAHFENCISISEKIDRDEESGFWINSLLYSAMMNDLLGNREKALKLYEEVLDKRDYKNAQERAKRFIKMPYKK